MEWIQLARDGNRCEVLLSTVNNIRVPQKARAFLDKISVFQESLLHGDISLQAWKNMAVLRASEKKSPPQFQPQLHNPRPPKPTIILEPMPS